MEEARNRLVFLEESSFRLVSPFHLVSPFLTVNRESRQEARDFYELKLDILEMPSEIANPGTHPGLPFRFHYAVMHDMMREFDYDYIDRGSVYVSLIRDVFVQSIQPFLRAQFWKIPYRQRICTPELKRPLRNEIRRLAYCHIQLPTLSIDEPDDCYGKVEGHIRVAEKVLKCANKGWQARNLRGIMEHGMLWIDRPVPQSPSSRGFASTVLEARGKSSLTFQRLIRRVEGPNGPHWAREIEDPFVGIRPSREQKFSLGLEDLADLVGEL